MTEYIGSRISLLSKSNIRYVGTLHEISSETATVALENVRSYGTEGRLQNPDDEIAASDTVYEYIKFRGSDVKDLRIEEAPAAKENKPPQQMPNDPAILGSGSRPAAPASQSDPKPQAQQAARDVPGARGPAIHHGPQGFQPPPNFQQGHGQPPQFPGQPPFPYYYPPPGRGFPHGGPPGGPPGPAFPGMPYGPPPGWFPPNGQGFPQGFNPNQMPPVPPGQQQQLPPGSRPALLGTPSTKQRNDEILQAQAAVGSKPSSKSATPAPAGKAPPPPLESKPSVATALAPPKPLSKPSNHSEHSELAAEPVQAPKAAPKGPKSGRIVPAVPIASPNVQVAVKANGYAAALAKKLPAEQKPQAAANAAIDSATHAATAAVAAAMAKLPPAPGQQKGGNAIDNLTQRVNDMRTNDRARHPRGDGTHRGGRGPRGAHRGGERGTSRTVDVPKDDYDFETANARFNKQDLVKEAIASGSPIESSSQGQNGTSTSNASQDGDSVTIPPSSYNKSSSFFDDISSESKDRDEKRPGGREWRGEEQRKNLETFGQGSVDNGYRGGFRGRGRGRGFGRGRGGFGRGGNRGQRGDSPSTAVPSTS